MELSKSHLIRIGITANIIEWYDFCISAFMVVILGKVFFGVNSQESAVILGFSAFSISYFIRPFGCIFFGYIGDKCGTAYALKMSILLMFIPTILIGILPSYNQIGYLSSFAFVISKLVQGFASGGELPVSGVYMYKATNSSKYKFLYCSFVQASSTFGLIFASLVILLIYCLFSLDTIKSWAWRVPFLINIPLTLFVIYIRKNIAETTNPEKVNKIQTTKAQFLNVFAKTLFVSCFVSIYSCILFIWMPSYLETFLHMSIKVAQALNLFSLVLLATFTLFFGFIYSRIEYKRMFFISSIALIMLCFILFHVKFATNLTVLVILCFGCSFFMGAIQGCFMYSLNNVFANGSFINLGVCLSYTLPTAIVAGSAPVICTYGIKFFDNLIFPATYTSIFGIFATPFLYFMLDFKKIEQCK